MTTFRYDLHYYLTHQCFEHTLNNALHEAGVPIQIHGEGGSVTVVQINYRTSKAYRKFRRMKDAKLFIQGWAEGVALGGKLR